MGCKQECQICKAPIVQPKVAVQKFERGAAVVICGLESRIERNGIVGIVLGFTAASDK